jgi:indolepyruvate ferredoxin oxidoreductase alpha subunit
MNVAYNGSRTVTVIMDNRITAMTGQQQNPGTGFTLQGEAAPQVDIPLLCEAIGINKDNIHVINPLNLDAVKNTLDHVLAAEEASVVITRWPCALKRFSAGDLAEFELERKVCVVDSEKCTRCKLCVKTGCPAIYGGEVVTINGDMCTGCAICMQVCPFGAIGEVTT